MANYNQNNSIHTFNLKRILLILFLLGLITFLLIINGRPNYTKINSEEAKEIILTRKDLKILDIRKKEDFEKEHIPQAIQIDYENIESSLDAIIPNKTEAIIIYGYNEKDSKSICKFLINKYYRYVYDLGSINNWEYKTIKPIE